MMMVRLGIFVASECVASEHATSDRSFSYPMDGCYGGARSDKKALSRGERDVQGISEHSMVTENSPRNKLWRKPTPVLAVHNLHVGMAERKLDRIELDCT